MAKIESETTLRGAAESIKKDPWGTTKAFVYFYCNDMKSLCSEVKEGPGIKFQNAFGKYNVMLEVTKDSVDRVKEIISKIKKMSGVSELDAYPCCENGNGITKKDLMSEALSS